MVTESITSRVEPAAALKAATNPHHAPERSCPTCGQRPPAGMVRCPTLECRGDWAPINDEKETT